MAMFSAERLFSQYRFGLPKVYPRPLWVSVAVCSLIALCVILAYFAKRFKIGVFPKKLAVLTVGPWAYALFSLACMGILMPFHILLGRLGDDSPRFDALPPINMAFCIITVLIVGVQAIRYIRRQRKRHR